MIFFICQIEGVWTIDGIIKEMPTSLSERITTITYEELIDCQSLPFGTYVFCGLGIQSSAQYDLSVRLWLTLKRHEPAIRLLNNPSRVLHRYELLTKLADEGINDFRAYRASEKLPRDVSFPVFIREERNHSGILTDLLYDRHRVERALRKAVYLNGYNRTKLLVVEYCNAKDERGFYKKYVAFREGEEIIPKRISYGNHWNVAFDGAILQTAEIEEEYEYVLHNPHEIAVREVFNLANIDYGRIDYGVSDGKLQYWEINTAPAFGMDLMTYQDPELELIRQKRMPAKLLFNEHFFSAISILGIATEEGSSVLFDIDNRLKEVLERERRRKLYVLKISRYARSVGPRLPQSRFYQLLRKACSAPAWWVYNRLQKKRYVI